jgi:hypothetical protein
MKVQLITPQVILTFVLCALCIAGLRQDAKAQSDSAISRGVSALIDSKLERCVNNLNSNVKSQVNGDDQYGFLTHPSSTPNKNGSSLITAADFSDGTLIRTFHVVPDAGKGCSILVHISSILNDGCAKIRDASFKDWKLTLDLGASTAYELREEQEYHNNVILTPTAGGGCVANKVFTLNYLGD